MMYHVYFNNDTEHTLNHSFRRYNDAIIYANLYDTRDAVEAFGLTSIEIDNGSQAVWFVEY